MFSVFFPAPNFTILILRSSFYHDVLGKRHVKSTQPCAFKRWSDLDTFVVGLVGVHFEKTKA